MNHTEGDVLINKKYLAILLLLALGVFCGRLLSFDPAFGFGLSICLLLIVPIFFLFFAKPLFVFCIYFLFIVNLDNFVLIDSPVRVTVDIVVTSILMVLIIFRFLIKKEKIEIIPMHVLYAITLVPCFVSIFVSLDPILSVKLFFRLVSYLLISIGLYNTVVSKDDLRKVLVFIALSAVIPCLFGYLQYLGVEPLKIITYSGSMVERGDITAERIGSTLTHPVYFGLFLTVIMPIIFHLFQAVYKDKKILFACVTFALIGCSVISLARAPWVALVLTIILYCLFTKRVKVLFVICCMILCLYCLPIIHGRWSDFVSSPSESSFGWRVQLWKDVLGLFCTKWQWVLLGVGSGRFIDLSVMVGYLGKSAHNVYIQRLVDTGLWGIFTYCIFLLYVVFGLCKLYKKVTNYEFRNLIVWCLSLHLGLMVSGISNSIQPSQYVYFFAFLTLAFKTEKLNFLDKRKLSLKKSLS